MFRLRFDQRIVIAFVLMTVVVSGAFSLSIVGVVHFVENSLVSQELHRQLFSILHDDIRAGRPPRLDGRTHFFAAGSPAAPIPDKYAHVPDGLTEIEGDSNSVYIYQAEIDGIRYLLVQDQQEFENREQVLFNVVLAGFILCITSAWILGLAMSRRVMAPVARLAGQVRRQDPPPPAPLAADYADDEIGQLAAAFDETLGKLGETLKRERLFTSDVSHELRTPLMVISTSCELLAETGLAPAQRAQVARIARAADEMRRLVQTFLLLAREEQSQSAHMAPAAEIARELHQRWQSEAQAKGLAFELVERAPQETRHDSTLLRAVMDNLLRNAVHYTVAGSVRLVLERDGFSVEDTGSGIESDERERIFQPFVRGSAARGEGLGLGLSLAKKICDHQGWEICAESGPDGGSRFRVILAPGSGNSC